MLCSVQANAYCVEVAPIVWHFCFFESFASYRCRFRHHHHHHCHCHYLYPEIFHREHHLLMSFYRICVCGDWFRIWCLYFYLNVLTWYVFNELFLNSFLLLGAMIIIIVSGVYFSDPCFSHDAATFTCYMHCNKNKKTQPKYI